jgi:hypothetical protein
MQIRADWGQHTKAEAKRMKKNKLRRAIVRQRPPLTFIALSEFSTVTFSVRVRNLRLPKSAGKPTSVV